jgi:antitoxin (DNA-binding transcriptional repressor) of toxin-antitoxin stability system
MLHFYKFRDDLFDPQPGKDVYVKRPTGRGWPEECPPIRAANAFGFDILANFDVSFVRQGDGTWLAEPDIEIASDFDWSATEESPGRPLSQRYAWFWERGQTLPHAITDDVFQEIKNQVKISSFLFLETDPNEMLLVTDVPNLRRPWRAVTAIVETDWYPASYPWHVVLELDASQERIDLKKGEPIARLMPVRRDTYFARPMSVEAFDRFFTRGQKWLAAHGRPHQARGQRSEIGDQPEGAEASGSGLTSDLRSLTSSAKGGNGAPLDITRTYVKQQARSRFIVMGG